MRGGEKKQLRGGARRDRGRGASKQLAQKRYAEVAEQFTNTVYEQSDSLQPAIDKLKLEKRSATVQRTPAPGATGPLASAKLLEAVFGNDAVRNKRNTDAVEVGPNQLASARVVEYTPARTLPLAEVQGPGARASGRPSRPRRWHARRARRCLAQLQQGRRHARCRTTAIVVARAARRAAAQR